MDSVGGARGCASEPLLRGTGNEKTATGNPRGKDNFHIVRGDDFESTVEGYSVCTYHELGQPPSQHLKPFRACVPVRLGIV